MTDKQQLQGILGIKELLFHSSGKGRNIAEKQFVVEPVVDGLHISTGPSPQVISEGLGWSDGTVCPMDRPAGEDAFNPSVHPHAELIAATQVAFKIHRGIERIATEHDLRNRRLSQRKVACTNQNVGSRFTNKLWQLALLKPESRSG